MLLNIVAVAPLPPWRTGAAVMCAQLLGALSGRAHRIRVLAPLTSDSTATAFHPVTAPGKLQISWFAVPFFAPFDDAVSDEYRRWEGTCIREWVERCIAEERPDVVLVGRGAYGLHVPALARSAGLPCVVISHGGPTTPVVGHGSRDGPWNRIVASLGEADVIVTPAHHWADSLRRCGLTRISVIPNPVDLVRFAPRPPDEALVRDLGLPAERVVVVHTSNLQAVKRPMDFLASAERTTRVDSRLVYVVIGDGPLREALVAGSRARGLADRFRFVRWIDHDRMPAFLSLADMVVMMSDQETQALVYLESQAAGRVLLASDVPGAREVIVEGETGVLFRTGDVAHLAERTIEVASRPAWRAEIAGRARDSVGRHALSAIAEQYERVLAGAASAGPTPDDRRAGNAGGGRE
jgi:glycosyltransferase involved in cell wall biosynthesis